MGMMYKLREHSALDNYIVHIDASTYRRVLDVHPTTTYEENGVHQSHEHEFTYRADYPENVLIPGKNYRWHTLRSEHDTHDYIHFEFSQPVRIDEILIVWDEDDPFGAGEDGREVPFEVRKDAESPWEQMTMTASEGRWMSEDSDTVQMRATVTHRTPVRHFRLYNTIMDNDNLEIYTLKLFGRPVPDFVQGSFEHYVDH
jgi:hypothetical protein